ncbi:MAG TPA: radical SAM protein [Candidatus Obscuribacterales bacterium]
MPEEEDKLPPILANYYLTYKCNSRCTYCDIPIKPENIRIKETSPEVIIENLAALKRLGVKVVDFTGGEPLIYKHFVKVVRAAKEMGFFISVANTGTLYQRVARDIKGLVDDLKFSLSTVDPAAYKAERGIDGHARVIESIKLARSLGEQPSIIATATPESIWEMEKVVRLAQDLGVIVLLGPVFDYCDNDLLHKEGIEEIRRLSKMDNVCVNWAFLEFYLDGGNQIKQPRCRAISSTIVISPDDHLLLPCYHMHDERIKITHENGRSNLDDLWHSTHVQEKRKMEGAWGYCQGCTIWCYFETSFLWPPDKYFFLNTKSKLRWAKERAKQYLELKTGLNLTRRLPGEPAKQLTAISTNPLSGARATGGSCGSDCSSSSQHSSAEEGVPVEIRRRN